MFLFLYLLNLNDFESIISLIQISKYTENESLKENVLNLLFILIKINLLLY